MHKLFKPNLTPKEIIQMGSFGGTYFHPTDRNIDPLTMSNIFRKLVG